MLNLKEKINMLIMQNTSVPKFLTISWYKSVLNLRYNLFDLACKREKVGEENLF